MFWKKLDGNRTLTPFWCLFILTGLNLFNYLDRYVLSAVLTPLKEELNLTDGQLGSLSTAFMIGYFVSCPFFGYLGDRMKRKWLIAAGVLVWSVATVKTGFAGGFISLLFLRVLVGLGEASYATIAPSLISDTFVREKRNNALTIFYVAIPVGAACGYIVGGSLSEMLSWRWAFIWAGAPGLLLALSLLPFKEPRRGQMDPETSAHGTLPGWKDILKLFKNTEYNLVCWGYTAYSFALGAYAYWGPSFVNRVHGMSNKDASLFFGGVLVVAGLIGTLLGGFLATSWQKKSVSGYAWMLALSTFVTVPASLAAFWVEDTTLSLVLLGLAMLFAFLPTGPVNTLILETVPANLRASAMALSIFMIHMFGDMWSPWIVGLLADSWQDLRPAISILPAAFLVGAFLWLWLALRQQRSGKLVR
jgi:MFS transporter, Spinster family, sphingosine-1-phosphate transporter